MVGERILVADDEPEIVDLCSRLLIGQGYAVRAAMSGQAAIAHLEAEPFDLLVIDIKMPDMDGLTVLRRGRELNPDLAAVVITGFATMDSALEAMHSGARGFVLKPFGLQEFIQVATEALEEARKERERLRLRAQLPILEIAQALLAESDPGRVAGQLLETVGRELATEQALLALVNGQTNELTIAGAIGLSATEIDALRALRLPVGEGIVGQAARGDKPVLLDGNAGLELSLQTLLGEPDARFMLVPLRTGKESVGVLILSRTAGSRPFTAGDLDLMSITSTQIATALQNTRLFRETEQLRTFNESIVQSVAEAIVIEDAEGVITFINPAMEALVGYNRHELVGQHWSMLIPPDEIEQMREQPIRRIPRVASRYERALLSKSGLTIPVILNARPLFEEERFVGTLSAITDITELKQAEDELRRRNAEMGALNAIAAATSQSLDLEEVFVAALEQTLKALDAEGGLIYLFEEASQSFVPAAHLGISQDVLREVTGFKLGVGLSGRVAESGEALVIADMALNSRNLSPAAIREGWRSYAAMPIKTQGKVLGVMTLVASQIEHFKPDHVELLSHIGNRVGVAIENAQLYRAAQQEINERKRAEKELADTKVLMEAAFEQTPVPMVLASMPDMTIRIANSASREFLGIQDEPNPVGTPLLEVKQSWQDMDSDGTPLSTSGLPLALAFQGVTTRNKELRTRRKDGTERWELVSAAPIYNAAGELIAGFVAFPDITEAKRAEEALRESEERYRALFENSLEGIGLSKGNRIITANQALLDIFGYEDLEEFRRIPLIEHVAPESRSLIQDHLRKGEKGEPYEQRYEYRIIRKDGQVRDLEISADHVKIGEDVYTQSAFRDITERKRAEEALQNAKDELEKKNAGLQSLYHVGQMVNSTLETDTILAHLTDEAMRVTRATHGQVLVVREDINGFERRSQRGFSPKEAKLARTVPLQLDRGVNGRAYLTRQTVRVDDVQTEADYFPLIKSTRTELAVPIMREGRVLGNLDLQSPEVGAFRDVDLDYLNALAAQGAIALENARFYEEKERQNARLQSLYRVGQMINSTLETDAILDYLADEAMRITRATHGQVLVVRQDLGDFECRAMHGYSAEEEARARTSPLRLDQGVNGRAYTTRQPVCLDDAPAAPYYSPCVMTTRAELAIPIMREGRVLGNLDLQSPEVGAFRDVDLDYLSALAGQVAIALENANLYGELRQRVAELTALNIVSSAVASSLDLRQTLTVVTDYATQLLDVAATSIALKTDGELWFAAASGEGSDFVLGRRLAPGQGITGWVIEHGETLLVPDVSQDPRFFRDFLKESEFVTRSILCVPLQTKGQTIGAIELINKADDRFGLQDARLLASLAAPAATAIENARLFEEVRAGRDRLQVLSRRLVEVQEAERRHIARELHDEVGQVLTGLKLTLEMGVSSPPDEFKANLEEAQVLVNELMAEVRNLSLDLRPAMLDDLGLLPALLWHFERYTAQTQVHVAFKQIGLERRFQPEIETVVYRIIQEALTNVARHAGVDNVTVRVWADEQTLNVQVEDQGTGFDLEAALAANASSGLSGMYERVGLLGGQLKIESIAGTGTWLTAKLSLSGLHAKEEAKP